MNEEMKQQFTTVTKVSKCLALALFVALPFIGGYVGYQFAPEKVVEVQRMVELEKKSDELPDSSRLPNPALLGLNHTNSKLLQYITDLLPPTQSFYGYSDIRYFTALNSYIIFIASDSEFSYVVTLYVPDSTWKVQQIPRLNMVYRYYRNPVSLSNNSSRLLSFNNDELLVVNFDDLSKISYETFGGLPQFYEAYTDPEQAPIESRTAQNFILKLKDRQEVWEYDFINDLFTKK